VLGNNLQRKTCLQKNISKLKNFQICGLCLLSVGVWALNEKNVFSNLSSNTLYDPAFVLIVSGSVTFLIGKKKHKNNFFFFVVKLKAELIHPIIYVGFTGCVGSLRENTFLLSLVSN
jgi:hypothetical protein